MSANRSRLLLLPLLLLLAAGSAVAQRQKNLTPADMTFKGLRVGMTQADLARWLAERSSFLKADCKQRSTGRSEPQIYDGAEYCNFTFIYEQKETPDAQDFRRIATTNDRTQGEVDAEAFILFAYLYKGSVYGLTVGTPDETDRDAYVLQLRALWEAMSERYGAPTAGLKDASAAATAAKGANEDRVDVGVWRFQSGGHTFEIKLQARFHDDKDYESWLTYNDVTLLNEAFEGASSNTRSGSTRNGGSRSNF